MATHLQRTGSPTKAKGLLLVPVLVLILAPVPFLTMTGLWPRWISIMALAWWLPGGLLISLWRVPRLDLPTAGALAAGLGLCWMILLVLLVHWLPGPITLWLLLVAYEAGAILLMAAVYLRRTPGAQPGASAPWGWVAVVLFLALILRLPSLGYQEFHEDEVFVLGQAVSMIDGAEGALAGHTKGPGEIALVAVVYRALGTVNEATARLPFALLGVGSVFATALLGRRLFSPVTGFWAGVLFAMNGFALGLSRIVQYQPAVLLLSALAVMCAWEFAQRGEGRWLALAATFGSFGLVMHYELALLAPALLLLAWLGWRRTPDKRPVLIAALSAGMAGTALVVATHMPILLGSGLVKTQGYLGNRIGGLTAFNVPIFVELGTFYNSTYYFAGLILLVLVGMVLAWRAARQRLLLLVLWFGPFLILHLFVMQYPGTHFYLLMVSWSLLAALPLAAVTTSTRVHAVARYSMLALAAIWLGISVGYVYLVFFRQAPEYVVNYDETRLPLYWAPYGERVPQKPWYGIPVHQGWKAVGTLAEWGCLGQTFASNERTPSLDRWYMPGIRRLRYHRMPQYIYVAKDLQKPDPQYTYQRLEGYQRVGEVRSRDEPRIDIWAREPLPVPYVSYDSEVFVDLFDKTVPVLDGEPDVPTPVPGAALGEAMTLESARFEPPALAGGDALYVRLAWRPQQALLLDYKLFVHVADESGHPVVQWDGFPCLNTARTSTWQAGEILVDHVVLAIPRETVAGEYGLLVGFYDPATGKRLGDQAIEIGTIEIH
jgi:hypothetical protein